MAYLKAGDKVRIKDRPDWPMPPGYRFANAEGTVVDWVKYEEAMQDFQDYVNVRLDKIDIDVNEEFGLWSGWWPPGTVTAFFRADELEKI